MRITAYGGNKERLTLYGVHFPWPGFGHVAEEKDGFRCSPEATKWISKIISSRGNAAANRNRAMLTKLLARRESTGIGHVLVADKARLSRRALERRDQSI
jgi:hypothetical protein